MSYLFSNDPDFSLRPQPNERPNLPGFYELHQSELRFVVLFVLAMLLASGIYAAWKHRKRIRSTAIDFFAFIVNRYREVAAKFSAFWSEVNERARKRGNAA